MMTLRYNISLFIILSFTCQFLLLSYASEEQLFRDEIERNRTEPSISYDKYQTELEKLLKRKPIQKFELKYVLFPLGIIAIGIVLIFFIKQIRMNLISEVRENEVDIVEDIVSTEKAALAHANTAEASNDFRGALRYLYLSAVLHLQENGILPDDKSLTNREYLHQSQVDTTLQEALGPAVTVFDEVWYGHKPCDAETVANYRDLLQKVYTKG